MSSRKTPRASLLRPDWYTGVPATTSSATISVMAFSARPQAEYVAQSGQQAGAVGLGQHVAAGHGPRGGIGEARGGGGLHWGWL
ncbi:hypothetical protein [Hymenobacter sp. UYCo722]|uniref:hypothetical protein n=1 Tax=Hymenobacter sp. UYCo722 TaxID=3156335 RepID=UPI003399AEEE